MQCSGLIQYPDTKISYLNAYPKHDIPTEKYQSSSHKVVSLFMNPYLPATHATT